jgi:hypothetical protein
VEQGLTELIVMLDMAELDFMELVVQLELEATESAEVLELAE